MSVSSRFERRLTPLFLIDDEIINILDAQAINLHEGSPNNAPAFVLNEGSRGAIFLPERPHPTRPLQ